MSSRYSRRIAADEGDAMTMDEAKRRYTQLEKPAPPPRKRYKVNDATAPKLHEISSENPRGIMTWRDELIGLFSYLEKPDHAVDKALYLESWNGVNSYTEDRVGRGTVHAERLCWSVFGGITPSKLARYLNQIINGIDNDGFIQRFQILVYPDKYKGELIDRPPDKMAADRVFKTLKWLDEIQTNSTGIPWLHFDNAAQLIFDEWYRELRKIKLVTNEHPIILEHLSKYAKLMPALALIFHLIHNASDAESIKMTGVCSDCALRSAAWCDFLEAHARRIYGTVLSPEQAALKFADKIKRGLLPDGFTVRDVRENNWSMLNTSECIEAVCDLLIRKHWLRRVDSSPGASGGRPTVRYKINPKIKVLVAVDEQMA